METEVQSRLVAGIDVGGTKLDACLVDRAAGQIVGRDRLPTLPERGGRAVLDDAVALVRRLAGGRQLEAVGIGICELVDPAGTISSAVTVDWTQLDPIAAFPASAVTIESDVRAAAGAEALCGAGRRLREPWLYVSVGTGISYALVLGGRPYPGARGNAIMVGAPPVEHVASGLALARAAGRPRAEDVLDDPAHAGLVERAARALGEALAFLANALDPALIVMGGGLGLRQAYRDQAARRMRELIEAETTRQVRLVGAELGSLAAPLGAALAGSRGLRSDPTTIARLVDNLSAQRC